jgi:hypothetical protein
MDNGTTSTTAPTNLVKPVVPLLAQIQRLENLANELSMRLDPITVHDPKDTDRAEPRTVTQRLAEVGNTLQYLLDHIEL